MRHYLLICVLFLASCSSSVVAPPPVVPKAPAVPKAPDCPAHYSRLTMNGKGFNGRMIHEYDESGWNVGTTDTFDTTYVNNSYWDDADIRPDSADFTYVDDTVKLYHQYDINRDFCQEWGTMVIDTQAHTIRSMKLYWQREGDLTTYRGLWAEDLPYEADSLGVHITLTGPQITHSITALNRTDRTYKQISKVDQLFNYWRYELWGPMPPAATMTFQFCR